MKRNNPAARIMALLLAALTVLSLAVPAFSAESTQTVYIQSVQDLMELAKNCTLDTWSRDKTVVLQADLSLEEADCLPIPTFGGTFDGGGHTISGLKIVNSVSPAGLFGTLQQGALVKNLNVSGAVAPSGGSEAVGGIAGENNGAIENCTFSGNVSGSSSTGGIAGVNGAAGVIVNCQTSGAVFGKDMTGGIAGCNLGNIISCQNSAYVNITSVDPTLDLKDLNVDFMWDISKLSTLDTSTAPSDTGGVAGYSSGAVQNCTNHSTVGYQHIGYNVGGIVGRSCGYLSGCENRAEVYGRKDVGGVTGQMEPYIAADLSEDTLSTLRHQLEELNHMVNSALDDANAGANSVTARLNRIADYLDSAFGALDGVSAYGSVSSTVSGSGASGAGGSVSVTPPQFEVSAGGESGSGGSVSVAPSSGSAGHDSYVQGGAQGGLTQASAEGQGGSSGGGRVDAATQIELNASLNGLSSAVSGMSGQMRLMNSEIGSTSGTLTNDLKAINQKINDIANTLFDGIWGGGQAGTLSDTSEVDVAWVTLGKAVSCINSGTVNGDINVGGIAGAMAIEYELDPEDDVTANISGAQRRTYELKAVIQSCVNRGGVEAKRSYAGGVCGRMDLGLVLSAENYGDVQSENGDYIGGIAGITGGTVRNCFAKCTLRGGNYIGGIVGSGVEEKTGGSSSTVSGCCSLVSIPEYQQCVGAVSGARAGTFLENYFVSEELAGINRMSYSGQAEPIAYSSLTAGGGDGEAQDCGSVCVPEEFLQLTLRFVADGTTLKTVPFQYGGSFDESVYPELPEKQGYYACWDRTQLQDLRFDTVVTAVYTPYATALSSVEKRGSGRPVFFTEGQFDDGAAMAVTVLANTPDEFDVFPEGLWDTIVKCFTKGRLSREIVEQWSVEVPEDGLDTHTVRYLPPDGKPENLDLYVKQAGKWVKAETQAVGSYLTFPVEGTRAEIAAVSTMSVWWVWLIAAALALLLLTLAVRGGRKVKARRRAAARLQARRLAAVGAVPQGMDEFSNMGELRMPQASSRPVYAPRRRWLVPLLVILALLCGIAGTAAFFLLPGLKTDLEAYSLLKKYAEQPQLTMQLSVQAQAGGEDMGFTAQVDRAGLDGTRVNCVSQEGWKLFYAEGAVFLENGTAYQLSDSYPDYTKVLDQAVLLYQHVDVSEDDGVYTITAGKDDANQLLALLMPSASSLLSGANTVKVELLTDEKEVLELRFTGNGTLNDPARTEFDLSAVLVMDPPGQEPVPLPQAVKQAIQSGDYKAQEPISGGLLRLWRGWMELDSRDPLAARLTLNANCGPLVLSDQLDLYRWKGNGEPVSSVQKNGYALYFTQAKICDQNGTSIPAEQASPVEAAKLLEIAYQACLNGELRCEQSGGTYTYTLALDEEGMKAAACAIAPDTGDMDILFDSGSIQITARDDGIQSIRFSCGGSMPIVLSSTGVTLSAEITFPQAAGDLTVPDAALRALEQ